MKITIDAIVIILIGVFCFLIGVKLVGAFILGMGTLMALVDLFEN